MTSISRRTTATTTLCAGRLAREEGFYSSTALSAVSSSAADIDVSMSVAEEDIAAFQALINDAACRHVLVLTGAGVSAESGE